MLMSFELHFLLWANEIRSVDLKAIIIIIII